MGIAINRAIQLDATSAASKLDTSEPLLEAWGGRLDSDLLVLVMVRRSFSHEYGKTGSRGASEHLELLGDTVLQIIVAEHLHRNFPDESEGTLAQMRTATIFRTPLVEVVREIHLGGYLRLGADEDRQGGHDKGSTLSDTLKALIGATPLSCGLSVTWVAVKCHLRRFLRNTPCHAVTSDWRTTFKELLSTADLGEVAYKVVVTGPDHQRYLSAQVLMEGENWGEGQRSSKKIAGHQTVKVTVATLARHCPEVVGSEIHQDLFPGRNPNV